MKFGSGKQHGKEPQFYPIRKVSGKTRWTRIWKWKVVVIYQDQRLLHLAWSIEAEAGATPRVVEWERRGRATLRTQLPRAKKRNTVSWPGLGILKTGWQVTCSKSPQCCESPRKTVSSSRTLGVDPGLGAWRTGE